MTRPLSQPYCWLLLFIVPVALFAYISGDAFHILLYDTYFVVGPYVLSRALAILLAVEALLYFLTRSFRQSKLLQRMHLYTTALALASLLFLLASGGNGGEARFYNSGNPDGNWVAVIGLAILIGHLAFVVNLVAGFIRGKKAPL